MTEKPFACNECTRAFTTEGGLADHQKVIHSISSPFACEPCGTRFASSLAMDRHNAKKHRVEPLPLNRRPTLAEIKATCIECGGQGQLVGGERIYPHRPDLYAKQFYLCQCGAYCGCHPGSIVPLGNPCGPETRRARSAAHDAFDPLWRSKAMSRPAAYAWLAEATGIRRDLCHIGMMNAEQARSAVRVVLARRAEAA